MRFDPQRIKIIMSDLQVTLQDVYGLYVVIRTIDITTLPFKKIETIVEVCSLKLKDIVQLVKKETAKEAHYLQQYILLLNRFSAYKKRYMNAELNNLHSFSYSYGMRLFVIKRLLHVYSQLYRNQYQRMERVKQMLNELSQALYVMSEIILMERDDDSGDEDLGSNSPAVPLPGDSTDSNSV